MLRGDQQKGEPKFDQCLSGGPDYCFHRDRGGGGSISCGLPPSQGAGTETLLREQGYRLA